jgi:hypothetical protein
VAISACAEEAGVAGGFWRGGGAEVVDDLALGLLARDVEVAVEAVLGGDDGEEVVDGSSADFGEHLLAFGGRFGQVAHGSLRDQLSVFSCQFPVTGLYGLHGFFHAVMRRPDFETKTLM